MTDIHSRDGHKGGFATRFAPSDYSIVQKTVHWLMTFLIIAMLFAGQNFNGEKELAERIWSRAQHGSAGILVGIFLLTRLVLRFLRGVPEEEKTTPKWQRILSRLSHWGMYLIMASLVVSGVAVGLVTTDPMHLPILGGSNISIIANTSEAFYRHVRLYHSLVTDVAIGFIALHVVAAFYHLIWMRDRIMQRMAAFWRSEPQGGRVFQDSKDMDT